MFQGYSKKKEPTPDMKNFGKRPNIHKKKQENREIVSGVLYCVGVSVQISRSSLGKMPRDIGSQ